METSRRISIGGGHCCVCTGVCHHIGGPWLCDQHKEMSRIATPYRPPTVLPFPERPERATVGAKPCPAKTEAILGFPKPTTIPCGLIEGHAGRHAYSIEWGGEIANGGDGR